MPASPSKCRVLIVDDDKDNAESLFLMLQAMGCDAEFLIDPLQALATVARQKPSIVFLDIGMPKLDGYQLAEEIRARYPYEHIALVALTGYTSNAASPALIESTLHQFNVSHRP